MSRAEGGRGGDMTGSPFAIRGRGKVRHLARRDEVAGVNRICTSPSISGHPGLVSFDDEGEYCVHCSSLVFSLQ